jgi:hypothetical protein
VAIRGGTEPLKYAHDGEIVLPLPLGTHTVVVGCDGCVMERRLEVSTLDPMTVAFATNDPVSRVFEGCPEAVDPYLVGEGLAAASALERAGQTEVAHLVRARHYQEAGDDERAAAHFQAAGQHEQAAQLGAFSDDPERSASLYEQAGDFARAAENYEAAGDTSRAAEAYEASYEYDKAIEAYRAAGRTDKVVELLEKTGGFYEAGVLALEAQDLDRAVSNLQQVDLRDPDYAMACRMLADILDQREEYDLAAAKLTSSSWRSSAICSSAPEIGTARSRPSRRCANGISPSRRRPPGSRSSGTHSARRWSPRRRFHERRRSRRQESGGTRFSVSSVGEAWASSSRPGTAGWAASWPSSSSPRTCATTPRR